MNDIRKHLLFSSPIKLLVEVPPDVLLHPRLVIMVVEASEVFRFPKASEAPGPFSLPNEDRLPKVCARGIPCYANGELVLGCFGAPPRLGISDNITIGSQHPIK